jgi:hypothetical protein
MSHEKSKITLNAGLAVFIGFEVLKGITAHGVAEDLHHQATIAQEAGEGPAVIADLLDGSAEGRRYGAEDYDRKTIEHLGAATVLGSVVGGVALWNRRQRKKDEATNPVRKRENFYDQVRPRT